MKERQKQKDIYNLSFFLSVWWNMAFPDGSVVEESTYNSGATGAVGFSLGCKNFLEKEMAATPIFLPEKIHGQWSLSGVQFMGSLRDRTEWLSTHTGLSRDHAQQTNSPNPLTT